MARFCVCFAVARVFASVVQLSLAVHVRKNSEKLSSDGANDSPEVTICDNNKYGCCTWNEQSQMHLGANQRGPMVLFAQGCTGSTATIHIIEDLAELAKQGVLHCAGSYELTKDITIGKFGSSNSDLALAMKDFAAIAEDYGRRLLYKDEMKYAARDAAMMRYMKRHGAIFLHYERSNKLDLGLCNVHDCFDSYTPLEFGYQVQHHKRLDTCEFRGRGEQEDDTVTKIHVNTENLLANLRHLKDVAGNTTKFLRESSVKFSSVTYEELFSFNDKDDVEGFEVSVQAWGRVMKSFNVHIDALDIRRYLKAKQGEQTDTKRSYRALIDNFHEVQAVLDRCTDSDCGEMQNML